MSKENGLITEDQGTFETYLDTFREGTSRILKTHLKNEVGERTDDLFGPQMAVDNTILFGNAGFKNHTDKQKAIKSAEHRVQEALNNNVDLWLDSAADWAVAYHVLTGKKCWSFIDNERMKYDLNRQARELQENTKADPKTAYKARIASNYRLLFGANIKHLDSANIIKETEKEMKEHIKMLDKADSSTFPPVISRAANIKILMAEDIIPIKDKGIKIVDHKPSQNIRL